VEGSGVNLDVVPLLRHEEDRDLLAECGRAISPSTNVISVMPLGRVGFGGSRLYAGWIVEGTDGLAHVIKINQAADIDDEHEALGQMYAFFEDAAGFRHVPGTPRSAIVYRLIRRSHLEIEELKDIVFKDVDDPAHSERLVSLIGSLYERRCSAAHKGERRPIALGEEYRRYWRDEEGDRAGAKLGMLFDSDPLAGSFSFLEASIRDPRLVRREIEPREIEVTVARAVHGDLHPNNVLIDQDGFPHLIDFAWGHCDGHVLKDFVLLECSLRFLMFPSHPELSTQLEMDIALLEEDGPDALREMREDRPLALYYRRLGAMLEVIRSRARCACGDGYDFSEYLAAQFCILYGLLKYRDYHVYLAARALGLIANRLESESGG
jgi:Ternary complex associated domain 9